MHLISVYFPGIPEIKDSQSASVEKIQKLFNSLNWKEGFGLSEEVFDSGIPSEEMKLPHFSIFKKETSHCLVFAVARNTKLEAKILALFNWEEPQTSFFGLIKSKKKLGAGRLLLDEEEANKILQLFLTNSYEELDKELEEKPEHF